MDAVRAVAAAVRELLPAWAAAYPDDRRLERAVAAVEAGDLGVLSYQFRVADLAVEDATDRLGPPEWAAIDAAIAVRRLVSAAACPPGDGRDTALHDALGMVAEWVGWQRTAEAMASVAGPLDVPLLAVLLADGAPVELSLQAAVALAA